MTITFPMLLETKSNPNLSEYMFKCYKSSLFVHVYFIFTLELCIMFSNMKFESNIPLTDTSI